MNKIPILLCYKTQLHSCSLQPPPSSSEIYWLCLMLFLPFLSHHFTTAASSVCFLITNYNQKRSLIERDCTFYSFLGIAPPLNFHLALWRKPLLRSLVCRQPQRADDTSFSSLFFQILFAFSIQISSTSKKLQLLLKLV